MAEAGAGDRLQRQLRHVAGHVHRAARGSARGPSGRSAARPRPASSGGSPPCLAAEARGEDVVRELPVGLVVVRGEQPVPGDGAQIGDAEADVLGEPRLVGQVGGEIRRPRRRRTPCRRPCAGISARAGGRSAWSPAAGVRTSAPSTSPSRGSRRGRMRDAVQLGPAQLRAAEPLGSAASPPVRSCVVSAMTRSPLYRTAGREPVVREFNSVLQSGPVVEPTSSKVRAWPGSRASARVAGSAPRSAGSSCCRSGRGCSRRAPTTTCGSSRSPRSPESRAGCCTTTSRPSGTSSPPSSSARASGCCG